MERSQKPRNRSPEKASRQASILSASSLTFHTPAQLNGAIPGRLVVLKPESTFKLRDPLSPLYGPPQLPMPNPRQGASTSENTVSRPIRSYSLNSYDKLIKSDSVRRRYSRRYRNYDKSKPWSVRWCSGSGSRRPCVCLIPLMFGLGIVGAFALYFGFRGFSTTERPFEKVFRGAFKVIDGDTYSQKLSDPTSDNFLTKAQQYEVRIEEMFQSGALKGSVMHAEVVAFEKDDTDALAVTFNLYVDTRKTFANATTIRKALEKSTGGIDSSQNRTGKVRSFEGLTVDPRSIEVKERNFGAMVEDFTTTLTKRPPSLYHTRFHKDSESAESKACSPVTLPFCRNLGYNYTSYPNMLGFQSPREVEKILEAATLLVNSDCSPRIKDVLCHLIQPPCNQRAKKVKLCRNVCQEASRACSAEALNNPNRRTRPPSPQLYHINNEVAHAVKELLQCAKLPKDDSSCSAPNSGPIPASEELPSGECVKDLGAKNLKNRVCDGVMDCADFSDEMDCGYCPPGFVHCGVGAVCIDPKRRCDGIPDCPNGSDERACLTIAPSMEAASYVHQYFDEGFIIFSEGERMGKLCTDSLNKTFSNDRMDTFLEIFGEATCKQLTYRYMVDITTVYDNDRETRHSYAQLTDPSRWRASFMKNACLSNSVLRLKCAELECGIRPVQMRPPFSTSTERPKALAPGGVKLAHGDWPWHGALLKDGMHVCDGTLISDVWMLTSQSCFENSPRANWLVRFATVRTSSASPWEQEKRVIGMVRSPLPGSGVVLAKLDSPVIFSDFVRPSCLGYEGMRLDRNTQCVVLAWNNQGEELQEESVRLTSPELCMAAVRTNSSKILSMCAESITQTKSCRIDSFNGAPLLCQESQQGAWSLVGVATSYQRCREGIRQPTIMNGKPYESVALLADWVVRTVRVTRPISS